MKQDWHADELAQYWTLSSEERELLGNKTGAARLSFAVPLKAFQFDGRFPDRREDVAGSVVHLASQTGVPSQAYSEGEWSERTQRRQRARIRKHCGFRVFRAEDEPALVTWLSERVASPNPETETIKASACSHLRTQQSRPATERLRRLLRMAVTQREQRLVTEAATQLSAAYPRGSGHAREHPRARERRRWGPDKGTDQIDVKMHAKSGMG